MINGLSDRDLATFREVFNCVGDSEIIGAWDVTSDISVMLGGHFYKESIHTTVSPSASDELALMDNDLGACRGNWVPSEIMMTVHHCAS